MFPLGYQFEDVMRSICRNINLAIFSGTQVNVESATFEHRRKAWAKKVAAYMPADEEHTGDQARSLESFHWVTRGNLHNIGLQATDLAIPEVACLKS